MILGEDKWLLFTGRHFWNRKCRKKTWWQQEFAVFKCEATANSVTGHVCVNSNVKKAYSTFGSKKHRTILYIPLIIQANLINNQCDKFRIGWFSFSCTDCITKHIFKYIYLPLIPCHFYCMTDCPFHTA